MKIAWFKKVITPELGTLIAGYTAGDVSVAKLDDLMVTGLCLDDGRSKSLLVSLDLLALDGWYIRSLREKCARRGTVSRPSGPSAGGLAAKQLIAGWEKWFREPKKNYGGRHV
ncbi:MAG: hypothetical protein E7055_19905 [Lentisphaerae bacterium]|nr:hypothetical protein [Lentisphaerota bacterium]